MLNAAFYDSLGLGSIFTKVMSGKRLSPEDGLALFECPDITAIGALAHHARARLHGERTFYVVNRHINYTNVCVNGCVFCAFRRDADEQAGAFRLSKEDILAKIIDAQESAPQLDELHIVGGCHPKLPLSWFEDLFHAVKQALPTTPIKAFTAVEIAHFAALAGISTFETLVRL